MDVCVDVGVVHFQFWSLIMMWILKLEVSKIPVCIIMCMVLLQFNAFMTLIRDMLGKMETEHRSKLEQLDQMKQEQRWVIFLLHL